MIYFGRAPGRLRGGAERRSSAPSAGERTDKGAASAQRPAARGRTRERAFPGIIPPLFIQRRAHPGPRGAAVSQPPPAPPVPRRSMAGWVESGCRLAAHGDF